VHVHHLALRTRDVPRLHAFYRNVVGLLAGDGADRDPALSVWLQAGVTLVMIERCDEEEPDVPRGSMDLIAFGISATEREAFENRLVGAGIAVEHRTRFTLYFRDPDGRRIGMSHYPQPTEAPNDASPHRSPVPT
jgi:glyoxylase I family protein